MQASHLNPFKALLRAPIVLKKGTGFPRNSLRDPFFSIVFLRQFNKQEAFMLEGGLGGSLYIQRPWSVEDTLFWEPLYRMDRIRIHNPIPGMVRYCFLFF